MQIRQISGTACLAVCPVMHGAQQNPPPELVVSRLPRSMAKLLRPLVVDACPSLLRLVLSWVPGMGEVEAVPPVSAMLGANPGQMPANMLGKLHRVEGLQ